MTVTLETGAEICGSRDEPILTLLQGSCVWRRAREIREGDVVCCDRVPVPFGPKVNYPLLRQTEQVNGLNYDHMDLPYYFGYRIATLTGLDLDDTLLSDTRLWVSNFIVRTCGADLNQNTARMDEFCRVNQVGNSDGLVVSVPECIHLAGYSQQYAFVQGYLDTAGLVNPDGSVVVNTASEPVAEFLFYFCGCLGCRCRLVEGERGWQVQFLRGADLSGLFRHSKQYKVSKVQYAHGFVIEGSYESVRKLRRSYLNVPELAAVSSDLTVVAYNALQDELKAKKIHALPVVPLEYDYIRVKEVRRTAIKSLYDLMVPEGKRFVANGVVVHNTTLARVFAKAVNCEKQAGDACGVCGSCRSDLATSGNYVEYDSSIVGNVATLRQLQETFSYAPVKGYRCVVFDESQAISRQAQASLLKVTEEAPEGIFFLSCTTDPDSLLPALRSRHLELELSTAPAAMILQRIERLEELEGVRLTDEMRQTILERSCGHFRLCDTNFELAKILGAEYGSAYESARVLYARFFGYALSKDLEGAETESREMLRIPLAYLRMDLETFFCDLTGAVVGRGGPEYLGNLSTRIGNKIFSLAKFYLSPWGAACFDSDKNFLILMRAFYTMASNFNL